MKSLDYICKVTSQVHIRVSTRSSSAAAMMVEQGNVKANVGQKEGA